MRRHTIDRLVPFITQLYRLPALIAWLEKMTAAAIGVFGRRDPVDHREALLARWIGESVNGLLPAGQIGGPVMMVRQLFAARDAHARRGRGHHGQCDAAGGCADPVRGVRCLAVLRANGERRG